MRRRRRGPRAVALDSSPVTYIDVPTDEKAPTSMPKARWKARAYDVKIVMKNIPNQKSGTAAIESVDVSSPSFGESRMKTRQYAKTKSVVIASTMIVASESVPSG